MAEYTPTATEQAEYTLKSSLVRIECAFEYLEQYDAPWKFQLLFVSNFFRQAISESMQYLPLSSPWVNIASGILRNQRYGDALVICQHSDNSPFWRAVPDFLACMVSSSLMSKGKCLYGTGTRGKDILELSFYSPTISNQRKRNVFHHFCDSSLPIDLDIRHRVKKYRHTTACLDFVDLPQSSGRNIEASHDEIKFCTMCGVGVLHTYAFEPKAIDQMHRHVCCNMYDGDDQL